MRRLGPTVDQLARYRKRWDEMVALANDVQKSVGPGSWPGRLTETAEFGANPGDLRMWSYVPEGLDREPALVVVLHGCKQNAGGYDDGAGWSVLADRFGFAVLLPEQQAANNPNNCFNWFQPGDTARGRGEAHSIRQMVEAMVVRHGIDRRRIFVTGLSAGGAMTSVMLATYPELFAGGAIIAGLAFGAAQNVRDALESMRSAPLRMPAQWGDLIRAASSYDGPRPRVSVWHGALDTTVNINNAQAILTQWADLHGLSLGSASQELVDGAVRVRWGDQLEVYTLATLGHGTPIDSSDLGQPGPFILEAGISSSRLIAQFWGLEPLARPAARPSLAQTGPAALLEIEAALLKEKADEFVKVSAPATENLIWRALKAAGLIRR